MELVIRFNFTLHVYLLIISFAFEFRENPELSIPAYLRVSFLSIPRAPCTELDYRLSIIGTKLEICFLRVVTRARFRQKKVDVKSKYPERG